jgi:type II secretory pathway pseudopilin PulG
MLVVIAITIVLMGLLFGPLTQSFRLTQRGRAMIAAQDNARTAMNEITRDLQDAMVVYDGLPISMYGYTNLQNFNGHPHPDSNSQADIVRDPATGLPLEFRDAMVDMVLPRSRYYCTQFHHYLTDAEVAPNEVITECPRHPGSPVESRPVEPLQPASRVRYFIGLRQGFNPNTPGLLIPDSNSRLPHYMNPLLFTMSGSDFNNPYVLYRAEFDPNPNTQAGQPTKNWQLPNGQINPNFFYDPGFAQIWKAQSVAVISPTNTDMVRWVLDRGAWLPQPMTRFGATPIDSETLTPNRDTVTSDGQGGFQAAARVPMQYVGSYGHWTGPVNDLTLPLPPDVLIGPNFAPSSARSQPFAIGPRIQIYESQSGPSGPALRPVYDSALPVAVQPRQRLFTWDSTRGIVNFALRADTVQTVNGTGGGAPDEVPFSLSLKRDKQTRSLPVVTDLSRTETIAAGFGSLLADAMLGPSVQIVPGSEVVQALDRNGQPILTFERAGWLGTGQDQIVAQADLQPEQYVIDYSNGLITFSDQNPALAGTPVHVLYQMHTNKVSDVVRVTYSTRELFTVNVGLLQFEPNSTESQEVQLSNRIRLRNLTH